LHGADFLGANPLVGRPMRDETDRREWFVAFGAGAHVLRYVVEPEGATVIIRVWHSREERIKLAMPTKASRVFRQQF
jgi:hypothetical protein